MLILELDGHTAIYLISLLVKGVKDQLFSPSRFADLEEEFLAQLPHDLERLISEFTDYKISLSVDKNDLLIAMFLYSNIFDVDETSHPVGAILHIEASRKITQEA